MGTEREQNSGHGWTAEQSLAFLTLDVEPTVQDQADEWRTCGAEYDWERDRHPAGPQPACTKTAGHESGSATDGKRLEHSNGRFHWPAEATRA